MAEASVGKLRHPDRTGLHLRVVLQGGAVLGPGRADLLQGVAELGSIAAAGRAMNMSYRRAWMLIEETAQDFGAPVVAASAGGSKGGRASLTELGERLLAIYRNIELKTAVAAGPELAALGRLVSAGRRAASKQ